MPNYGVHYSHASNLVSLVIFFHQKVRGIPLFKIKLFNQFFSSYGIDLVPTQERKLLELTQTIKPDDLSKLIEESITIKGSDDDNDSENSYNTDMMVE